MENKYYTPSEDEVRVGLYCVYTRLENGFNEKSFLKPWNTHEDDLIDCTKEGLESYEVIELFTLFNTVQDACIQIRIKYLDREDIESFGFKVTKDEGVFVKDEVSLVYEYDSKELSIYLDTDYQELDLVNNIKIKNKSELKDILEKTNII